MRERLPARRNCFTQKLKINGQTVHFSVGLYPDGRPGELFIDMHRVGTTVRAWCESTAKLISLMLQYNIPLSEIVESLAGHCTEPFGSVPVLGHPIIHKASGVLDAIMRSMALDYLANESLQEDKWAERLIAALLSTEDMSAAEIREVVGDNILDEFLTKFEQEEMQ